MAKRMPSRRVLNLTLQNVDADAGNQTEHDQERPAQDSGRHDPIKAANLGEKLIRIRATPPAITTKRLPTPVSVITPMFCE